MCRWMKFLESWSLESFWIKPYLTSIRNQSQKEIATRVCSFRWFVRTSPNCTLDFVPNEFRLTRNLDMSLGQESIWLCRKIRRKGWSEVRFWSQNEKRVKNGQNQFSGRSGPGRVCLYMDLNPGGFCWVNPSGFDPGGSLFYAFWTRAGSSPETCQFFQNEARAGVLFFGSNPGGLQLRIWKCCFILHFDFTLNYRLVLLLNLNNITKTVFIKHA